MKITDVPDLYGLPPMPENYALDLLQRDLSSRQEMLKLCVGDSAMVLYQRARVMHCIESLNAAIRDIGDVREYRLKAAEPIAAKINEAIDQ
jgi:hypothetical protein